MAEAGHMAELKKDVGRGVPLALFVGAGMAADHIPVWPELLGKLIDRAVDQGLYYRSEEERARIRRVLKNREEKCQWSPYQQAGMIKRLLGDYYAREVRDCLYEEVRRHADGSLCSLFKGTLLEAVASLCQHASVEAVVTYNFDNLLDSRVFEMGRNINIIYGRAQRDDRKEHSKSTASPLSIYHVHGFLPLDGTLPLEEDAPLVFSQEEYFQTMLEPFTWQTTTQLHLLRNYTCLFLGTSITDLNMLRILSHARSYLRPGTGRTYAMVCRRSVLGEEDSEGYDKHRLQIMRIWSSFMDMVGVKMICAGEDYETLRIRVDELRDSLKSPLSEQSSTSVGEQ